MKPVDFFELYNYEIKMSTHGILYHCFKFGKVIGKYEVDKYSKEESLNSFKKLLATKAAGGISLIIDLN